jgi:hypothetical protein
MEIFIKIENKLEALNLLFEIVKENNFTIVFEMENKIFLKTFDENIYEKELPNNIKNVYDEKYILKAFGIIKNDYFLLANILANVSALMVFDKDRMVFLIADDLHKDCFSCSENFYKEYFKDKHII